MAREMATLRERVLKLEQRNDIVDDDKATLRGRVLKLEQRNNIVDDDKRFETSIFRITSLAVITYLTMFAFMSYISIPNPSISAVIPTLGFTLSQLNVGWLRGIGRRAANAWRWLRGCCGRSGGSTDDVNQRCDIQC